MNIIIGREEGTDQPRLCLHMGDKTIFIGEKGSVSKKISRKHCNIEVDSEQNIHSITDITDNNFMFINGRECKAKRELKLTDTVELGPDKYRLDLQAIIRACLGAPTVKISGLKRIYDKYQEETMSMQIKQGKLNALSSIPMVFSMGFGLLAAAVEQARIIGVSLALVFMIGFAILRFKLAGDVPRKRKAIDDTFHKEYTCPSCGQFLGSLRPDDLEKKTNCPYCKAKWEK